MSRFSLMLRVDAPPTPNDSTPAIFSKASEQLRARLYKSLGLKAHNVSWITVVPGTAKGDNAIRALVDERRAGHAIVGSATLTELFDPADPAQARWFYLNTRMVDDFSLWDDYPSCKAGSLPKVHALNHSFVSSSFVEVCHACGVYLRPRRAADRLRSTLLDRRAAGDGCRVHPLGRGRPER
jgi:hypothetical protein